MKNFLQLLGVVITILVISFITFLCYGLLNKTEASGGTQPVIQEKSKQIDYCEPIIYVKNCKYEFTGYGQER